MFYSWPVECYDSCRFPLQTYSTLIYDPVLIYCIWLMETMDTPATMNKSCLGVNNGLCEQTRDAEDKWLCWGKIQSVILGEWPDKVSVAGNSGLNCSPCVPVSEKKNLTIILIGENFESGLQTSDQSANWNRQPNGFCMSNEIAMKTQTLRRFKSSCNITSCYLSLKKPTPAKEGKFLYERRDNQI